MDTIRSRDGRLHVLVNNAGVTDNTLGVEGVSGTNALSVLDTNVAGVVRVTQAALPLLREAPSPVIVNLASGLGSFSANTDPDRPESGTPLIVYAASKAAVAMLTLKYSQSLPGFKVNAVAPGFTATDFTADFGGGQPVEEAVAGILRLATLDSTGPTGTLEESTGPLAW